MTTPIPFGESDYQHHEPYNKKNRRPLETAPSRPPSTDCGDCGGSGDVTVFQLMDASKVDAMLPKVAGVTVLLWILITALVYLTAPAENIVRLEGPEQFAAAVAFVVFAVGIVMFLLPFVVGNLMVKGRRKVMSGVMIANFVILGIALITNGIMAFGPSIVYIDPVTTSRAHLLRYCEWTPLAALLTFLAEAVDLPAHRKDMQMPALVSILQMLSTSAGILAPMCPGPRSWAVVIVISCLAFFTLFTRVARKHRVVCRQTYGPAASETEIKTRLEFAYRLLVTCSCLWSSLVVLYFYNMAVHRLAPSHSPLRVPGLAMILDTSFDLVGKLIYGWLIVHVHEAAFDESGRARRRLQELQHMLSVLWQSSSEVIMLAVRARTGDVSVLLSPSFASLIGASSTTTSSPSIHKKNKALVLELLEKTPGDDFGNTSTSSTMDGETEERGVGGGGWAAVVKDAYWVDADHPFDAQYSNAMPVPLHDHCVLEAERLMRICCQRNNHGGSTTRHHHQQQQQQLVLSREVAKCDGSVAQCEIKVAKHTQCAIVAMIQDVTERHQLAAAEQRAVVEAISRQKDAQAVNRFVRHEVKNGLLATIELCDTLRGGLSGGESASPTDFFHSKVDELDVALHDILDTVLAEAMAREVIHEVYQPKLERLNVLSTLRGASHDPRKKERFPIRSRDDRMPDILMDPQLLLYIHRNAVSNACKYGKHDGEVATEITYIPATQEFKMTVTNLPGLNHDELIAMGEEAADGVFRQGRRLHTQLDTHGSTMAISSGDGAWIMQKCAKTLLGTCSIQFDHDKTVFTFQCPTTQFAPGSEAPMPWGDPRSFQVPEGSWAIAVDDSKIQRKLMAKLLTNAGFSEERQVLLGGTVHEMKNIVSLVRDVIVSNPESRVLILMDENLDICENAEQVMLSGSSCLHEVLSSLTEEDEGRVLALVRSANDSGEDMNVYTSRSHGFFPKAPMKRDRVRALLGELWYKRFRESSSSGGKFICLEHVSAARRETQKALSTVTLSVAGGVTQARWPLIYETLKKLRDALVRYKWSPKTVPLVDLINGMSGGVPSEFDRIWKIIQETVHEAVTKGTPCLKIQRQQQLIENSAFCSGVRLVG